VATALERLQRLRPGRRFQATALGTALAAAAIALWSKRAAALELDWHRAGWAFAAAVALFAVPPLLQSTVFHLIVRALGARASRGAAAALWGRAVLLRYAPTGALGHVHRLHQRRSVGASASQMLTAIAYEQLALLLAGAFVAALALTVAAGAPPVFPLAVAGVGVGILVGVHPSVGGELVRRLLGRRGIASPVPLRLRAFLPAVLLVAAGWLATGGALALLVGRLAGEDAPGVVELTGSYALAWLTGFLLPLLPAGLGIRDATFLALLATSLGAGAATATVITVRLALTLGELLAIGALELVRVAARRRTATGRYLF
jgi:hypothetical protein